MLIGALKGKKINKLSSGGSYCIALGEDVISTQMTTRNISPRDSRHRSPYITSRRDESSERMSSENSRNSGLRSSVRESYTHRENKFVEEDYVLYRSLNEFSPYESRSSYEKSTPENLKNVSFEPISKQRPQNTQDKTLRLEIERLKEMLLASETKNERLQFEVNESLYRSKPNESNKSCVFEFDKFIFKFQLKFQSENCLIFKS